MQLIGKWNSQTFVDFFIEKESFPPFRQNWEITFTHCFLIVGSLGEKAYTRFITISIKGWAFTQWYTAKGSTTNYSTFSRTRGESTWVKLSFFIIQRRHGFILTILIILECRWKITYQYINQRYMTKIVAMYLCLTHKDRNF